MERKLRLLRRSPLTPTLSPPGRGKEGERVRVAKLASSLFLLLALAIPAFPQIAVGVLDTDFSQWQNFVAQTGARVNLVSFNESSLQQQVYVLGALGLARIDAAEVLTKWLPQVQGRLLDLSPYAQELQAAGVELYSYGNVVVGGKIPWRDDAFLAILARSPNSKEALAFLKLLGKGEAAPVTPLSLSVGPLVVAKSPKKAPGVDGALESFVGAVRQAVPQGLVTALSAIPSQAQAAVKRVAEMWGVPLSADGTSVTVVLEPLAPISPQALGATRAESSPSGLQKAVVPLSQLESFLTQAAGRARVRLAFEPWPLAVTSEGANLVGAAAFHAQGIRGAGVKIAVIDVGFSGLSTSQARGDLPYGLVTRDFTGTSIDTGLSHGTAVAEIVYDIAPESTLYLVKIADEVDLDNAVTYCISEGVHLIVHSLGWFNTSFYDGTGVISQIADRASSAGILWVQAAGNSGLRHYGPTFTDANGDGWHDTDVTFTATAGQGILFYLTWDSWPTTADDYDLFLFDPAGNLIASSTKTQAGAEQPTERIYTTATTSGTYRVRIQKANGATKRLSLFSLYQDITPRDPASSMPEPANANSVLTVAAINWQNYATGPAAAYSSRGPTTDGRQKPDLSAPDNVTTGISAWSPFPGTSAAAPHAAGVAALLKAEAPGLTLSQLKSRVLSFCVSMGDPYTYGAGRLEARPQGPTAQPDLVVENITYSPPTPSVGTTVNFQVTVRNQGAAPAGSFTVRLQGAGPSQDRTVSSLAAGASTTLSFSLPFSTTPETFTATADVLSQVAESNEGNNTRQVTISGVTLLPDLVVENITYSPPAPSVGTTVNFQVTVRNQGAAPAGSFTVRLQGAGPSQDRTVSSLAAGASTTISFSLPLSTTPETFTATADILGQVAESNEGNNTRQVTISGVTPMPDLIVEEITYTPPAPTLGQVITFQIRVKNQGGASAGLFYVRLQGAASYQMASIGGLGAGMSHTVSLQLPLSTSPETFTATADALGNVAEANEANNTRQVTITAAQPPLSLSIATDKSSYTVDEPVRITVQINRANYYVYVVELDPVGRAILLFPNFWERDPRLPAGTTTLPRVGTYTIRASEPTGSEQIRAFAADRAIPQFPTSFSMGFPILSTNGAAFLSQVRSWLSGNVPSGNWAEASTAITIQPAANIPPTASFTFSPTNPLVNQWITFDGRASSDPDGTITSWAWDFGDGATGTGSQIQKRYSAPGTYTVALTVTDNRGATATTTRTVVVGTPNQPPTASFTFSPPNPDPGQNVTFNAAASSDPDGTITAYSWNFGDGTTGTGMNITKAYTSAGSYVVTLTVTDNLGATGTATRTIQVGTPPPPPPTLPGMPTIDKPGIYVWGDPENHWHITVAGDPSWPSPRKFKVNFVTATGGKFQNLVVTPAGPTPSPGQVVRWEGTIGAGWVDLRFDLVGATTITMECYLDVDGDGVLIPSRPEEAARLVFLRTCKVNPPWMPFIISVVANLGRLLPSQNFLVGVVRSAPPDVRGGYIEDLERQAGCR